MADGVAADGVAADGVAATGLRLSPFADSLRVTSEWRQSLLVPLLRQLREETCAHLWQPVLAGSPASEAYAVFTHLMASGRPSTVYTYYLPHDEGDEPVAVAMLSARVAADSPEDGIPVLGRTYVLPRLRRCSIYALLVRHRLDICAQRWKQKLLAVHMGTSSPHVESVFRACFPGNVVRLGDEDLGEAGVVAALLGITGEFERQLAAPVPGHLAREHRLLRAYMAQGADVVSVAEVVPALRALAECQNAYRLLGQFLDRMPNLS